MQIIPLISDAQKKITSPSDLHYNTNFFIENKGQWPSEVLYLTRMNGMNAWITRHGVTYDFYKVVRSGTSKIEQKTDFKLSKEKKDAKVEGQVINITLEGISEHLKGSGNEQLPTKINYILGSDSSKWVSDANCYKEATISNIYDGIKQRFYYDKGSIRYDYIVSPEGDPKKIHMNIKGSSSFSVNADGELVLSTRFGEVKQAELYTYQELNGKKNMVESKFVKLTDNKVGFEIGEYDRMRPLTIDPIIWCTYLGGSQSQTIPMDEGEGIAVNENNQSVYVCGSTSSINFPVTIGVYSQMSLGNVDMFISKLSMDGHNLWRSTYYGGSGDDIFTSVDVNTLTNNVFAVGQTGSSNCNVQPPGSSTPQAGWDILVVIFDENLGGVNNYCIQSTYLGGPASEYPTCIKCSQNVTDNSYMFLGVTDFQPGAFGSLNALPNLPATGHHSAFVARVDQSTPSNSWIRYLFGTDIQGEEVWDMDGYGSETYVAGFTSSTDFCSSVVPSVTTTYSVPAGSSGENGFIVKLNSAGDIIYSTVVGGTNNDRYLGIDTYEGYVYTTGRTNSYNLPLPIPGSSNNSTNLSTTDVMISMFDQGGALINNRYYGGSGDDGGWDINIDGNGSSSSVAISGYAMPSLDIVMTQCPSAISDYWNALFVTFDPTLTNLNFSRTFGGVNYHDWFRGMVKVGDNDFYLIGWTWSPSSPSYQFPVTHYAFQTDYGGWDDAFVMRLTTAPIVVGCSSSLPVVCVGTSTVLTGHGADLYSFDDGINPPSTPSPNPFITPNLFTTTTYTVTGYDAMDLSCSSTTLFTVNVGCTCSNAPTGTPVYTNPSVSTTPALANITSPIIINGTFTVDNPSIINNVINGGNKIFFFQGSSIHVTGAGTLNIVNSELDGCLVQWDSIHVDGSNSLTVSGNSIISHMTDGIRAIDGALLEISDSKFYDNANCSFHLSNMDFTTTGSFIERNEFRTTNNGLWAPFVGIPQGKCGIYIDDCWDVQIGEANVASSGNMFMNLFNGINAQWGINNTISTVGIHNNNFVQIEDVTLTGPLSDNTKLNQAYSTPSGAGIYSYAPWSIPGIFELNVTVDNTNSLNNPTIGFVNCDKAITGFGTNLTAAKLNISSGLMGIMSNSQNNNYDIQENEIYWVHAGIVLNNFYNQANVAYNHVKVINPVLYNTTPYQYHIPIGIKFTDVANSIPAALSVIQFNKVDLYARAGRGIENRHGKSGQSIYSNTINFFPNTTNPPTGWDSEFLTGIANINYEEVTIAENLVNGVDASVNPTLFLSSKSAGYTTINSPFCIISCNKVKYTAYGFSTIGNCPSAIKYNKCRNNVFPWIFDGLGGTVNSQFGDIGIGSPSYIDYENDFVFNGQSSISSPPVVTIQNLNGYYIFRGQCPIGPQPTIHTGSGYISTQSGASNPFTEYYVDNFTVPTTTPGFCIPDPLFGLKNGVNYSQDEINYFLNIADPNMNTGNDNEVNHWMDKMYLFKILAEDENLRADYNVLNTFYSANVSGPIGKCYRIDMALDSYRNTIGLVGDGFRHYMKAYTSIQSFNSSKTYEQNLNMMNGLLLETMRSGYDALTSSEKESVDVLSHSCLNQKGTAVLRARTIWSYYNPTEVFDDRLICFNVSNKNYKGDYDAYLTDQSGVKKIMNQDLAVLVYPNPASYELNISTSSETTGVFSLYTILGEKVLTVQFDTKSNVHTLVLPKGVDNGLYTYQYCTNDDCKTGKLTILK